MGWKPQEKELSQQEAVELAQRELAPYWFGIEPQLISIKQGAQSSLFPLDKQFIKQSWLLFFVDWTDFSRDAAFVYAREWYRRFHTHHFSILMIYLPHYQFIIQDLSDLRKLREEKMEAFPWVIDFEKGISGALGIQELPSVVLLDHGKRFFVNSGRNWLKNRELEIQSFLRGTDPGLPLSPIFLPPTAIVEDVLRVELGARPQAGSPAKWVGGQFAARSSTESVGQFHGVRPKVMASGDVFLSGNWVQDAEKITNSDGGGMIGFRSPSPYVSIVAQAGPPGKRSAKVVVEINGSHAHKTIAGENVTFDDLGESSVSVSKPNLYHCLVRLPEGEREITLRFPDSSNQPVSIYGIRFGDV
jgi:hypothetical protein